jgi:hypothetical protein
MNKKAELRVSRRGLKAKLAGQIKEGHELAGSARRAAGMTLPGMSARYERQYRAWDGLNQRILDTQFTDSSPGSDYRGLHQTEVLSYRAEESELLLNLANRVELKLGWLEGLVPALDMYGEAPPPSTKDKTGKQLKASADPVYAGSKLHSLPQRVALAGGVLTSLGVVVGALLNNAPSRMNNGQLGAVILAAIAGAIVGGLVGWWLGRTSDWGRAITSLIGLTAGFTLFSLVASALALSGVGSGPIHSTSGTPSGGSQPFIRDPSPAGTYTVLFNTPSMTLLPGGQLSIAVGPGSTTTGYPHALVVTVVSASTPGCPYDDVNPVSNEDFYGFVGVIGFTYFVAVTKAETRYIQIFAGRYTGTALGLGCQRPTHSTSPAGALEQLGKP